MGDVVDSFPHRFLPASLPGMPTLLLLHGTGGDENDLIPLAQDCLPDAALLSPRGRVLENGMPRFFRRLAEGVFDEEDLIHRTHELAAFIEAAAVRYGFDRDHVIAFGYSNGANIAASLLLLTPTALRGAVLLRAMVPLRPNTLPDLHGRRVLLLAGRADPLIPVENVEQLAAMLKNGGAAVDLCWSAAGHQLTRPEIGAAAEWLLARDGEANASAG
jgi:phospholipase/carboxylesterase